MKKAKIGLRRGLTVLMASLLVLSLCLTGIAQANASKVNAFLGTTSYRVEKSGESGKRYFSVSTQHYTFAASAFVELVKAHGGEDYEFSLLEERTGKIIENVRSLKSEIGILYMCRSNETVLRKLLKDSRLVFSPLFIARPHAFL